MDERLRRAVSQAEQEHVEKHAALLQTRAEESVAGLRKELVALEKRREAVADEVESLRRGPPGRDRGGPGSQATRVRGVLSEGTRAAR